MTPVLPDLDIWLKAFSRREPDPLVVHEFARLLRARRIFLLGWLRQGLLLRTRDRERQDRLEGILAGFPDVPILGGDHLQAAGLACAVRASSGLPLPPWRALMWAVARRMGGEVWSRAPGWLPLATLGCPVAPGGFLAATP